MTDCSSKKEKKTARLILTTACVALGLMLTTGVRATYADDITPPEVPGGLEVEDGNVPFFIGHGVGTQNYVCATSTTSLTGFAFSLFTPQATLLDDAGDQLITHFFSPNTDPHVQPPEFGTIRVTWEDSRDTSRVWAFLVKQSLDAKFVQKDAVAWLLSIPLEAGAHDGVQYLWRRWQQGLRAIYRRLHLLQEVSRHPLNVVDAGSVSQTKSAAALIQPSRVRLVR